MVVCIGRIHSAVSRKGGWIRITNYFLFPFSQEVSLVCFGFWSVSLWLWLWLWFGLVWFESNCSDLRWFEVSLAACCLLCCCSRKTHRTATRINCCTWLVQYKKIPSIFSFFPPSPGLCTQLVATPGVGDSTDCGWVCLPPHKRKPTPRANE